MFCKKVFFKISQNSQENTCVRFSFLIKLQVVCGPLTVWIGKMDITDQYLGLCNGDVLLEIGGDQSGAKQSAHHPCGFLTI